MLVQRIVADLGEPRQPPQFRNDGQQRVGPKGRLLNVRAVAIGQRMAIDLAVGKRLQPPMKDRQIGLAGRRGQPHERLPKRPPHLPNSMMIADCTPPHVNGAVHDDVREQRCAVGTLGGSPAVSKRPGKRRRQPVDRRVGSIEVEIAPSKGLGREPDEYVGDIVERAQDVGISGRIGVGFPRTRQILAGVVRVESPRNIARTSVL